MHYFQSLCGATELCELEGLQITKYDMTISNIIREALKRSSGQHKCYKDHCFAVVLYSICYLIISPCSYWYSNTLDAIIKNRSQLNNSMHSKHCLTSVTQPDSVIIFSNNINLHISEVSHGELSNLTESRISSETLILRNYTGKTGFLMWSSSQSITCIYQQNKKVKQLFSLLTFEDSRSPATKQTKHVRGVNNLVEKINKILFKINRNVRLWNMIYNLFAAHIKLLKLKGNTSRENTEKNMYNSMEPVAKKGFWKTFKENIQLRMLERRKNYFPNAMRD